MPYRTSYSKFNLYGVQRKPDEKSIFRALGILIDCGTVASCITFLTLWLSSGVMKGFLREGRLRLIIKKRKKYTWNFLILARQFH